jgi:hypothetical protein
LYVLYQKTTSFPTGFSQGCRKYQHPTTYLGLLSFALRWRDLIGTIMIKSSLHDQGTSGFFATSRAFAPTGLSTASKQQL